MAELNTQELALAGTLLAGAQRLSDAGLNRGSAGNLSLRLPGQPFSFLITPSGLPYGECSIRDMVKVGAGGTAQGLRNPSSEWRFHHDLYLARPEFGAVVHTHAPYATALACHGADLPPFHYMIARFGGTDVRCAPYATFGTAELSSCVVAAMAERKACLMARHGMLVAARDLREALALAEEFEWLCEVYWRACQLGPPPIIDAAEMARVLEKFSSYGVRNAD